MKNESTAAHPVIYLKDYKPHPFHISEIHIEFDLDPETTRVTAKSKVERRTPGALLLNGVDLKLISLKINGQELEKANCTVTDSTLEILNPPDRFDLEITTEISPVKNLSFSGLYFTSSTFCTQCEAEGFRKITYFIDRPDQLAKYTTVLRADATKYPTLLSNGNLVDTKKLPDGRVQSTWNDPWPKPSYLFAVVGGKLNHIEDSFTTASGKKVGLEIYTSDPDTSRLAHAMEAIQLSMAWDEKTYGREYDLDKFMIYCANDFNMGAMENKGLNIFNSKYIYFRPDIATDQDYVNIIAVVGHEYFHNWTGNRITCRDWFQLSLKEGLTVYRDQEFTQDTLKSSVGRIQSVSTLWQRQFTEDAGPLSHSVRPASYEAIDNFYTATIYEKGAEVIRMLATLVGKDNFRKGTDLYFEKFDGQAVTLEDFVSCFAKVSGRDLSHFMKWYDQAGTPQIKINHKQNQLVASQLTLPTPGQEKKEALFIPLSYLALDGKTGRKQSEGTFELTKAEQVFDIPNATADTVISLNRGFSTPVKVEYPQTVSELLAVVKYETDGFSRWYAIQKIYNAWIKALYTGEKFDSAPVCETLKTLLANDKDFALVAALFEAPALKVLIQDFKPVDLKKLTASRTTVMNTIAMSVESVAQEKYTNLKNSTLRTELNVASIAVRSLLNKTLDLLARANPAKSQNFVIEQLKSQNMTEKIAALQCLDYLSDDLQTAEFAKFRSDWKAEPLVLDKWLSTQALSTKPSVLERLKNLKKDELFDINNPNRIYSLYGAFMMRNLERFHDASGESYQFIASEILDLDSRNPQVASRLMQEFGDLTFLTPEYQKRARDILGKTFEGKKLSPNVNEVLKRILVS